MDLQRINELIKKYTDGTATEAEEEELNAWYREKSYHDAVSYEKEDEVYHEMLSRIHEATGLTTSSRNWQKWAVAAAVAFIAITATSVYLIKYRPNQQIAQKGTDTPGKQPAGGAILTLSNGSQVLLSDAANGDIATQGNVTVTKAANGQLIYNIKGGEQQDTVNGAIAYNVISTPAGSQFMVVLPDKTTVWLNAMSSLKFPVTFANATERRITLTGEAYFQVTHDEKQPFRVVTGSVITEDLGTEFNVKAYGDEPGISTTLVSGAARVIAGEQQASLRPGEQANYQSALKVSKVNIDDVIAWKDGYFRFDDQSLETIMKAMSRWYNVTYIFEDESLRSETFGVVATRQGNISVLLNLLENTGAARFRQEGTTIIISRK
ncbi:FecR family protein [Chitinophaga sp. YR627]|uniref:FecR family protein n=1 Tax=Chitinophaga sp. YR627 TaxID=1881041 RepID=UPI0008E0F4DE|nr:FecR domain-containing protein [Chitinophaga sp. YR627]SFO84865.1 FecR family protein [Chitinophaga sp. YR627]